MQRVAIRAGSDAEEDAAAARGCVARYRKLVKALERTCLAEIRASRVNPRESVYI